jgi:hypothetical protein
MSYLYRRIFKSQQTGVASLRELLQAMFVGELLQDGDDIWIVSPWLGNIVLIDNRAGSFDTLNPEWGRREVRLTDVLVALMIRGRRVIIVTRSVETNESFLSALGEAVDRCAVANQLRVIIRDPLHTKGILLSGGLLMGSMNITYNGLQMNDEWIEYSIDGEDIARTRLAFRSYEDNE